MSEANITQIPRASVDGEIRRVVSEFDAQTSKYDGLLPSNVKLADFRNAFLIAVQGNPRLLQADRRSLWMALQKAAGDGLKPDGREGALVIFGDDQEDEDGNVVQSQAKGGPRKVVWMPMVWGLTKLMRNTGNVASVRAKLIYRGEKIHVVDEDGRETYRHERVIGGSTDETEENIIGAYAVVQYKDNTWDAEFVSRAQIERVRSISRAKNGPWKKFYSQMCVKVPLRRLSLRVQKSAENERYFDAIQDDEKTIDGSVDEARPAAVTHQKADPTLDEFMPGTEREPVVTTLTRPTEKPAKQEQDQPQLTHSQPAPTLDSPRQPDRVERKPQEPTPIRRAETRQSEEAPWWAGLGLKGRALTAVEGAPVHSLEEARAHNWKIEPGVGQHTVEQIMTALGVIQKPDQRTTQEAMPLPAVSPKTAAISTVDDDDEEGGFVFGDPE